MPLSFPLPCLLPFPFSTPSLSPSVQRTSRSNRTGRSAAGWSLLMLLILPGSQDAPDPAAPAAGTGVAAEAQAGTDVDALADRWFEDQLQLMPCNGIYLGDFRFNDRYCVQTQAVHDAQRALTARYRQLLAATDRAALTAAQQITYDLLDWDLQLAAEGERFGEALLPINPFYNEYNYFAQLGSGDGAQPFVTVSDYDNWLKKIDGFVANAAETERWLRTGMEKGVVLPAVLVERLLPQFADHISDTISADLTRSVFWGPIARLPAQFPVSERARLDAAFRVAIRDRILPVYRRLHDFLRDHYLPRAEARHGRAALPDGAAWYAWLVKRETTLGDLTPAQIHELGVQEVARIHAEMRKLQQQLNIAGDLQALFAAMETDPAHYFPTADAALQAFRDVQTKVDARLPALFARLPKAAYEVRAIEAYRAASAPAAEYQPGSPDGERPGVFYLNTSDLKALPRYGVSTLSLHEAAPGHHFQIALSLETEGLPKFRQFAGYSAYVEGWALYAETLGHELQLFDDPQQYYGHLADGLLRAMRLVVDTGLHAKNWTREQAIRYMLENSSMAESDVRSEVERYMAIPAQALSYKIGQFRLLALRNEAEKALGARFDLRTFHGRILELGAVPMTVLEQQLRAWIAAQKVSPPAQTSN